MSQNKFLKCACDSCGGRIEFPADGIGSTIPCPHCGAHTELTLETPPVKAARSPRSLKWIIAGGVILLVGVICVVGVLVAAARLVKKQSRAGRIQTHNSVRSVNLDAARPAATNAPRVKPAPVNRINDFSSSAVTLDQTAGSTLAYASGALKNETDRQRFGVTVEMDLLDSGGAKIGRATDYAPVIEPRAEWKFRALLVPKNVASARVTGVLEKP